MTFRTTSCALLLSCIYASALAARPSTELSTTPATRVLSGALVSKLRSRVSRAGGCMANVCFALDGSSAQRGEFYDAQKNFVLDLVSIIAVDSDVSLAAVQYHNWYSRISHLTMDSATFVNRLIATRARGGASRTAIGIGRCARMLNRHRFGQPRKIILLGDGISTRGWFAVFRARLARASGNDLSVVAAGNVDKGALSAIVGGNKERMFEVDNFFDVLKLQEIIEKLVQNICGLRA